MHFKKLGVILIIFCAVMFVYVQPAMSRGCQGGADGGDQIDTDKTAPGTKLSGPLTIIYEPGPNGVSAQIKFFLRLRKGYDLYAFAGEADIGDWNDFDQIGAVKGCMRGDDRAVGGYPGNIFDIGAHDPGRHVG